MRTINRKTEPGFTFLFRLAEDLINRFFQVGKLPGETKELFTELNQYDAPAFPLEQLDAVCFFKLDQSGHTSIIFPVVAGSYIASAIIAVFIRR